MMMPVETNQWRATIGCFRVSIQNKYPLSSTVRPLSFLFQSLRLYWYCYWIITVLLPILPFTLKIQFLAVHSVSPELCFLPLFACMCWSAEKVLESLRFATRGSKTAYRSLDPSAQLGNPPGVSRLGNFRNLIAQIFASRSQH